VRVAFAGDRDLRAFQDEGARNRKTDAARSAGDECDFPPE
jgi:hypothetical protein